MTKKNFKIGIIAEDESDVVSIRTFIHRITKNDGLGTEKFIGRGCGKINRKCNSWARALKQKGCSLLFVVRDLDKNNIDKLRREIISSISPCPIVKYLIVIPVQEIEAWLLSDPESIKDALRLKKVPKVKSNTELIDSPKEVLRDAVYKASNQEKPYIKTRHNKIISEKISIDIIRKKCPSFVPFYDFLINNTK